MNAQRDKSVIHMPVIYQDSFLMAVDKPAGLLVHSDGTGAHTLTDEVRSYLESTGQADAHPQAVQRLDRETTGVVLFSLDRSVQAQLDQQVAGHDMEKTYVAQISGRLPTSIVACTQPLGRDRHDARKMRVCKPGQGKPAHTKIRELAFERGRSLVEIKLLTGRRHQIRVHLAHLGCPIVGDTLYAGPAHHAGLHLHALSECVMHPVYGTKITLRTSWPTRIWPVNPRAEGSSE